MLNECDDLLARLIGIFVAKFWITPMSLVSLDISSPVRRLLKKFMERLVRCSNTGFGKSLTTRCPTQA